jgi:hypothetical protein
VARGKLNPINNPDTTNTDPSYWEKVLASHGLSEGRALSTRAVVYVGSSKNLVDVENQQLEKKLCGGRRARPKGYGPDR